ncbi:MAG: ectonucleotide pyrophosphatase/phosphodiesterase [Bacteroidota bacterium]
MKYFPKASLILLFSVIAIFFFSCTTQEKESYVVMLSMDGTRWDYPERANTPNLDAIAENGVKAEYVIPAFPTKTFPNHYTMATGLYPNNHGIVDNSFYCPDLELRYSIGNREAVENKDFYFGEPIWVTAEKQGVTAASYFWVGSEAPVKDIQPTYWKSYDPSTSFASRIDSVIYWLSLPEIERPRLVMLYFDEPDGKGHKAGPDSKEIDVLMNHLDSLVGVLHKGLSKLPIAGNINLIVTSDHGMTAVSADRYVNLLDHIDRSWIKYYQGGNPMYSLEMEENMTDSVYNILKEVEHISVWKKDEIPERLNYGSNKRIKDIVVLADSSWSVGIGEAREDFYAGAHGWDNANKDMHTIFYATGPDFKENYTQKAFELVDLYPLIARILKLEPAEVDGKIERVETMLKK